MTISGFIEYVKQIWKNKPDRTTPITAAALTHIEDGIKGNSDAINKIAQAVVDNIVNDPQKIASMAALYAVNESVKKNASDIKDVNSNLGNLNGTLNIRTSGDGVLATIGSKDSKIGQYIESTSDHVALNYKVDGAWRTAVILPTMEALTAVNEKISLTNMKKLSFKWTSDNVLEFYVDNTRVFGIAAKWSGGIYS